MKSMRVSGPLLVAMALLLISAIGAPAYAQGQASQPRPIQISLFNPIQIFTEDESITGLRLNVVYGKNRDVKGLDLGLANQTTGEGKGLQVGVVNLVEGAFTGFQASNAVNIVSGDFLGYQLAPFNWTQAHSEAFQWGIVNMANEMSGFQLGLVNVAEKMYGLQIGIINVIRSKEKLPILPIVNWSF